MPDVPGVTLRTYFWFVVVATLLAAVLFVCVAGIRFKTPVQGWPGILFSVLFTGWWIWVPKAFAMVVPGFFAFRWGMAACRNLPGLLSLSISATGAVLIGNLAATGVLLAYGIPPVPGWQPELLVICILGAILAAFLTFGTRITE